MPETGNLWRTTVDIQDNWTSMISNLENNAGLAPHAGPGHWNDPDMLEVGNGGMTATEYQTHFTMWCMMAAPLILGNDLRNTSAAYVEILTNAEVIALDQDVAGIQGTRVAKNGNWEVWCKPLGSTNGGLKAAALLNLGTATASIQVTWQEIGLAGYAAVRDLWAHQDLGWFGNSFTASVPAHGVVALKITAGTAPTLSILSAQPPIQLRLLGVSNALTVVQRSIDLENWIPFLTNTPASNVWDFFDTNAPALQMFYRFVLQ
jgi:alpha-galactosidase